MGLDIFGIPHRLAESLDIEINNFLQGCPWGLPGRGPRHTTCHRIASSFGVGTSGISGRRSSENTPSTRSSGLSPRSAAQRPATLAQVKSTLALAQGPEAGRPCRRGNGLCSQSPRFWPGALAAVWLEASTPFVEARMVGFPCRPPQDPSGDLMGLSALTATNASFGRWLAMGTTSATLKVESGWIARVVKVGS